MTYAIISNWSSEEEIDHKSVAYAETALLPMLKLLGADYVYLCKTSKNAFSVITIYPDESTASNASAKQDAIHEKTAKELPISLISDARGEVIAKLE